MNKHFRTWKGGLFPVRTIRLPIQLGGYDVDVADIELFNAIEDDYTKGDGIANNIDNSIYYYMDSGFIASDPTDEEIVNILEERLL